MIIISTVLVLHRTMYITLPYRIETISLRTWYLVLVPIQVLRKSKKITVNLVRLVRRSVNTKFVL